MATAAGRPEMETLLARIEACRLCETHLEPRPVVSADPEARVLIVGQAPGSKVHASGVPWDDQSGKRLRQWLQLTPDQFYDRKKIAIVPTAFCYPGKGKSGDLPPPKVCASTWHQPLLTLMPNIRLMLLIGGYAQSFYLKTRAAKNLTETVRGFSEFLQQGYFPLPHPSPRNTLWLRKNPWFEADVLPALRRSLQSVLAAP